MIAMILCAKIKLTPTPEQHQLLYETLSRANFACNYISQLAWDKKTFNKHTLHHLCYYDVRERFGVSAQMAVRALGKVGDSYKLGKDKQRSFKKNGAFPFDARILKYNVERQTVSIWTLAGRQIISYEAGEQQQHLLVFQQGESDLLFVRGTFYLLATCEVPDFELPEVESYMGVDLGIVNIATTDDGMCYSGSHLNNLRLRHNRLRKKLQKKGTRSAKRRLKKWSGREKRFVNDVNHCISKAIVIKAKRTERGIALEQLTGIRERVRLRKSQRTRLHSWAFADLGKKISYKASWWGVPVAYVDPAYTSQTCSNCGHVDKNNRKTQSEFKCTSCGVSAHADVNAAINIGRRASVNAPNATTLSL